jgi:hypothetical protein
MKCVRPARTSWIRGLGMGLLVASLVHTPMPWADFHNIRHHDGPGEVCRFHDHLLTWHPDARLADDVAVLHWHWYVPTPAGTRGMNDPVGIQARVPDWSGLTWTDAPQVAPESRVRFIGRALDETIAMAAMPAAAANSLIQVRAGPRSPHAFSATFAPRVSLALLLQRWIC